MAQPRLPPPYPSVHSVGATLPASMPPSWAFVLTAQPHPPKLEITRGHSVCPSLSLESPGHPVMSLLGTWSLVNGTQTVQPRGLGALSSPGPFSPALQPV